MTAQIIIAIFTVVALFILFLVISQTTGNIDNVLYKLEYLLRKEYEIKVEAIKLKYRLDVSGKEHSQFFEEKQKVEEKKKAEENDDDDDKK
ncbi:MAG: hypothetical protein LBI42_08625 [Chitinispirillales bacterium]|jgi:low affinity Fe/Cu permease|nr:hypothetical protein [Chitinispirillales bacterium]